MRFSIRSTARETLAVARKMAPAESEETFDPELDDATQTARSELHEIESTIRNSLERAQNARKISRRPRRAHGRAVAIVSAVIRPREWKRTRQTETEKCQVRLQVEKQLEKISRDLPLTASGSSRPLMSLQVQTSVSGHEDDRAWPHRQCAAGAPTGGRLGFEHEVAGGCGGAATLLGLRECLHRP